MLAADQFLNSNCNSFAVLKKCMTDWRQEIMTFLVFYLSLMCRNQSRSELIRTCSSWMVWHVRRFFLRHAKMKRQEPETTHWSRTSLNLSDDDGSVRSGKIDCHVVDVVSCVESFGSPLPSSSWKRRFVEKFVNCKQVCVPIKLI